MSCKKKKILWIVWYTTSPKKFKFDDTEQGKRGGVCVLCTKMKTKKNRVNGEEGGEEWVFEMDTQKESGGK